VIDLFSWELLLRELQVMLADPDAVLPAPTASFGRWMQALSRFSEAMSEQETAFWEEKKTVLKTAAPLCKGASVQPGEGLTLDLGRELTADLLRLERTENVRMDVSLLTALGRAAAALSGSDAGICVESLGRPQLPEPIRIDGTVGWFTACCPIVVKREPDVTKQLFSVRRTMREVPYNGVGWLLKYGELPENADIIFNFYRVRDIDEQLSAAEPVLPAGDGAYDTLFPGAVSVDCEYRGGHVLVRFRCPPMRRQPQILKKLSLAFEKAVREIAQNADFTGGRADAADGYSDDALTYDEFTALESIFDETDDV
jgi:hypothetical protein